MSPNKDAKFLIEQLSVDFAAEKNYSCRDCLRSKAMPSQQVQTILQERTNTISLDVLKKAQSLVTQILGVSGSTALFQMNKTATAIRFLQLVLSLPHKSPLQHQPSNNSSATDTSISVDRLDQLIQACLTELVQSVCKLQSAWAQSHPTNEGSEEDVDVLMMDASRTHSDSRPVACFVFVSILRLQFFGKRRQQWMIPLCRGLCDLALASNEIQAPLPTSLIEDAIRSMSKLLEEGCIMLTNDAASRWTSSAKGATTILDLDRHSFFTKFLSFLVARITTLFPLLTGQESSATASVLSSSCKVLTLLLGLPRILTLLHTMRGGRPVLDGEGCLQNHREMAEKIEKQVLKVLWNKKAKEDRVHSSLLFALMEIKVKRKNASTPLQDMIRNGRIWGRAVLLQKLLARSNGDTLGNGLSRDTEFLLKLCEVYLAVVLPECFGILAAASLTDGSVNDEVGHDLIVAPLHSTTTFLVRAEVSLMTTDGSKRAQFHRLILRWLAGFSQDQFANSSKCHPMTTQFVSSLVYVYLIKSPSMEIHAVLSLMVKLLFDARTSTAFRSNIALVLSRLLASKHPLSVTLASLTENQFSQFWKEACSKSSHQKKRKRKKPRLPSAIQTFTLGDVQAIGTILSLVQCYSSSLLRDSVKSFIQEDGLSNNGRKKEGLKSVALLLWYMAGAIVDSNTTSGLLSDSDRSTVLQRLVERAVTELSKGGLDQSPDLPMPLLMSTMSILRAACGRAVPCLPLKSLCHLLELCTRANPSPGSECLLLEGTGLIGSLAESISESCSNEILASIRVIFVQTLSSQDTTVVRLALGSLVRFGRRLSANHASLLPTLLPSNRIPLFQARAQGLVWKPSGNCKIRMDFEHFNDLGTSLEALVHPRGLEKSMFPTLRSYHIACGSFYLQMPTKDGRQAIVIFPPGEQSLEDIRHMYEVQDSDDLPNLQVLQRVVLNDCNGEEGCKFILEPNH
jgi:hypothetical protein